MPSLLYIIGDVRKNIKHNHIVLPTHLPPVVWYAGPLPAGVHLPVVSPLLEEENEVAGVAR